MDIDLYQDLIEHFEEQGIKVEELTLQQISNSIKLYKKLTKIS